MPPPHAQRTAQQRARDHIHTGAEKMREMLPIVTEKLFYFPTSTEQ